MYQRSPPTAARPVGRVRAGSIAGAHQEIELLPFDPFFEEPEECLLPRVEDLVNGIGIAPERGSGLLVVVAQRLQLFPDRRFVGRHARRHQRPNLREQPVPLALPMTIVDKGTGRVGVELAGTSLELIEGGWSNWVTLRFRFAGFMSVTGLVRLYLERAFPELQLYVSPIQIDPRDPVGPIASPLEYAGELAQHVGLYHTVGMAEETWSLNEEQISDSAYLDMVKTVLAERDAQRPDR